MSKKLLFLFSFKLVIIILTITIAGVFVSFGPSMAQMYEAKIDPGWFRKPFFGIRASLGNALNSGDLDHEFFQDKKPIEIFYQERSYEPYWMGVFGPHKRVKKLISVLESSWEHGLSPARYHVTDIKKLFNVSSHQAQAKLEILLSDAFIRYVRDLSGMHIDPEILGIDPENWRRSLSADQVLAHLQENEALANIFEEITPTSRTYRFLQQELARLISQPEEPYVSVLPIEFEGLLRPAQRHRNVPDLRLRLGVEPQTSDLHLYDDRLTAAVIKFQRENGLMPDGLVGSNTLHILNRSRDHKIGQIVANLERLRWVNMEERPERFVVINVPSATLWAIDKDKVEIEMPVVVGRPDRPTESFITDIRGVRFNPDWTVPPTIKRDDILPKLREDSGYLQGKGIELINGYGEDAQTIDPTSIDWADIGVQDLHRLRMVQSPGQHNPLGRIRILMPNKYNIYLHGTNDPQYFERPDRAVSSGCIRLKDPEKFAGFVMHGNPGWEADELQTVLDLGKTKDIAIASSIPVYVLYYTAWVDVDGQVVYGNDIYGRDERLLKQLSHIDDFYISNHNKTAKASSGRSEIISVH